jgi:hypothetical protein
MLRHRLSISSVAELFLRLVITGSGTAEAAQSLAVAVQLSSTHT